MDDIKNSEMQNYLRQRELDKLAAAHSALKNFDGPKEATPEFLEILEKYPDFMKDRERSGTLVVPADLKFTHNVGSTTLKTSLMKADIPSYRNESESVSAYVQVNFAALAKFFPDIAKKSFRNKRFKVEFEQRRCPHILLKTDNLEQLKNYMEQLENVMVYFLARFGADQRKLQRTADGELVMPVDPQAEPEPTLKDAYSKSLNYRSFAAYGTDDEIPFGIVTRTILPYFCRMINLHYLHEETTQQITSFAFPMLDIGLMRFSMKDETAGANYKRIAKSNGRPQVKHESITTGDWLRHEMYEMLSGPMREMGLLQKDLTDGFDTMVREIRSVLKAGRFNPSNLSPTHEAVIPRLN